MNDYTQYLHIAAICLMTALYQVAFWFTARTIKKQDQLIQEKEKFLDATLIYCLVHIHNKAVVDEDYENAKKCRDLLDGIKGYELKSMDFKVKK